MKADWEDAPDYIRRDKNPGPWRMVVILGIGSAITWTLIALFAKPIVIDVNQIKQGIRVGDQLLFSQQPAESYRAPAHAIQEAPAPFKPVPQVARLPLSQAEIEWFDHTSEKAVERIHNTFNDKNYKPRTDINTMQPPPQQYYASNTKVQAQRQAVTRQTNRSNWRWENGYHKMPVSGRFEWVVINGNIDFSTVCQNYKYGSLIYRDCRKGAKVAFKNMCGSYEPACSAANNFMP